MIRDLERDETGVLEIGVVFDLIDAGRDGGGGEGGFEMGTEII